MDDCIEFFPRSTGKAMGYGIKWRGKFFLDLDYNDDLSILDGSVSKMNEFLEVLRTQQVWEVLMFINENINQVDSFTNLFSIIYIIILYYFISKDSGCSDNVKGRIAKTQDIISQLKKVWKNWKISRFTNNKILEAIVASLAITVVNYGSEAWTL